MKTLIYTLTKDNFKIECFKLNDVNELTNDGYEITSTNSTTKETESITTNTPQGAIALADLVMQNISL